MSDDEIENPSRQEMLSLIDHAEQAICPSCGAEGQFQVLSIEFDGIKHDFTAPPKIGSIILTGEKKEGIPQGDVRANSPDFTPEDLKNALIVMERQLEAEHERTGAFVENQNGSFTLRAKFEAEPPYIKPWGFVSQGFTYAEIKEVIDSIRSQLG